MSTAPSRIRLDAGIERYVGLDHLDPVTFEVRRWGNVADGTTFTRVFEPGEVLFGKATRVPTEGRYRRFRRRLLGGHPRLRAILERRLLPSWSRWLSAPERSWVMPLATSAGSLVTANEVEGSSASSSFRCPAC